MGNDNVKDYPPYLDYPKPRKPITNADRIRQMSDEELAEMWWEIVDCGECVPGCGGCNMTEKDCKYWVLAWLKEEVMNNGLCESDTEVDSEG